MSRIYAFFHVFFYALIAGVSAFVLIALFAPYQAQWGRRVSADLITGLLPGVTDPDISAWIVFGIIFTLVFAIVLTILVVIIVRSENISVVALFAMGLNVGPSIWFGVHMHQVLQGTFAIGPIYGEAITPQMLNVKMFVDIVVLPGIWYLLACMLALVMRPRTATILFIATVVASGFPLGEIAVAWFQWMQGARGPNLVADQAMVVWLWVECIDILILAVAYMLATRAAVVEPSVAHA